MTPRRTRPTLVDLAREAGVSRGTASNVFTHPDRVRAELREHVTAVAARIGYAGPDPRGRLLRAGRFNALGFVAPGAYGIFNLLESPYGRELLLGIGAACDSAGVALSLFDGRPAEVIGALRHALVDGLIVGHGNAVDLMRAAGQRRLPFVVLDTAPGPEIASVAIDAEAGARAAAEHVLGLGHRRLCVVAVRRTVGPPIIHRAGTGRRLADGFPLDGLKLAGIAAALAAAGLSLDAVPIVEAVPWEPDLAAAVRAAAPDATAILAMSDRQALTLLADCRRTGIAVPATLSLIGFDDIPEAAAAGLTTIAQPIREKGRRAAEMLLGPADTHHVLLPTRLVVRETTGPAPA